MNRRTLIAGPGLALTLLLAGCGGTSPATERRDALNAMVVAANAGDADAMRAAADDLVAVVDRQSGSDLPPDEVARIREAALAVKQDATLIDADTIAREQAEDAAEDADRRRAEAEQEAEELRREMEEEQQRQEQEEAEAEASASATPSPEPEPTPEPTATETPEPTPTLTPSDEEEGD